MSRRDAGVTEWTHRLLVVFWSAFGFAASARINRPGLLLLGLGRCDYRGFFLFEDCGGGGDAVTFFEAQEADALRRAAGFADFAGVDADYFALAGDDHHVGIFPNLQSCDDGAVAIGGLQVDDAFAAARGDAIFGERRALAVAFFGNREHERRERFADLIAFELVEILRVLLIFLADDFEIGLDRVHADDVIIFREIHPVDASRAAAHRANFRLAEEDGLAVVAGEENHLLAVGEFCADQFIFIV